MATQNSNAGKPSKSADAKREAPAKAPEETTAEASAVEANVAAALAFEATGAEAAAAESVTPEPAPVVVEATSAPLAVVEQMVESATEAFSVSIDFDAATWTRKSFELWAENANAFLNLAERVAKAQTFEEVVGLQSRFANERLEAFVRQSKELMEFAQSMAGLAAAPLCDVRKAA
jgi:hypothetical protein